MQVMFVVGLEHDFTKLDTRTPDGLTKFGLQDEMTFIESAAALTSALWLRLATGSAGTSAVCGRLGLSSSRTNNYRWRSGTWCTKVPRKRLGIGLFGSAVNVQHTMHAGLGQVAEAPTQTVKRLKKALTTLQSIERFAYDQHDHVSFAKVWMLLSRVVVRLDGPAATTLGTRAQADDVSTAWWTCIRIGVGAGQASHVLLVVWASG